LQVGGVEREPRVIRQVLQRRVVEQVLAVCPCDAVGYRRSRQQQPGDDGPPVDIGVGHSAQRDDDGIDEIRRDPGGIESQFDQLVASAAAVIDPPHTLEKRSICDMSPTSFSRQSTPMWKTMAR
jgi:hypothetical protein